MANNRFNKQVTPKGYKMGGRVSKMGGGMMKRPMYKDGSPKKEKGAEIVLRSLSSLIKIIGGKYYNVRGKSIQLLIKKIKKDGVLKKTTLGRCFIEKFQKTIIISREN